MATTHAFNHNPKMASAAAACGGQGWRGPLSVVTCEPCLVVVINDDEAHAADARERLAALRTGSDMPEFPTPICPDAEAGVLHARHRIEGTWRQECPGVDAPAARDEAARQYAETGFAAAITREWVARGTDDARYDEARQAAVDAAHAEAWDEGGHVPCAGSADCYCADREPDAAAAGTVYGRPTPMPAPAAEPVDGRQPDAYGVAVGDLIAGTAVTSQCSAVGVVLAIVQLDPNDGLAGNRYFVRCGELYPTGEPVGRVVHDHPSVIVPAGNPVKCATCGGQHESALRFVDCLIAHVRAEREAAAVSA